MYWTGRVPAGGVLYVTLGPWLENDAIVHGRACGRNSFSSSSKTVSAGRPSPRSADAKPSLTA